MNAVTKPTHSALGASGAERWMHCPGSVAFIRRLQLPETDEADYQMEGTAAHAAAAWCLRQGKDAWEAVGLKFDGVEVTAPMADAIQEYLSVASTTELRAEIHDGGALSETLVGESISWFIEYPMSAPELHPDFYGTVDFAVLTDHTLDIVDFKYGQGVVVEPENNSQLMYYAMGLLHHANVGKRKVSLTIVQPRAHHPDGSVRFWQTTEAEIRKWCADELMPAMQKASAGDNTFVPGEWCRFCPAKLMCPALTNLADHMSTEEPAPIPLFSDVELGDRYRKAQAIRFYLKALEDETFRRLNNGVSIPGTKLVAKRSNRVWKDGAQQRFQARFGADAFTEPQLKSPSVMEKLGSQAIELIREYAYTPDNGLTVALAEDRRAEVKVQNAAEAFGATLQTLGITTKEQ